MLVRIRTIEQTLENTFEFIDTLKEDMLKVETDFEVIICRELIEEQQELLSRLEVGQLELTKEDKKNV